jgi:hypothetical protein
MTDDEFHKLKNHLVEKYLASVDVDEQLDYIPRESAQSILPSEKESMRLRWAIELADKLGQFWSKRQKKGLVTDDSTVRSAWQTKCKRKKANRKDQYKRRRGHIKSYGSCCERCGETRWEFLAVDHVSGGGTLERSQHGKGDGLLRARKRQGYPSGYRILCHNCNFSLGKYGYCPMTLTYSNLTSLHEDDAWRIAIHEAGHAIAGVRFEKTFAWVEIGDNEHGEVDWTPNPFDPDVEMPSSDDVRTWQTIYAAGAAAEQAYFGEIRRHAIRCDQVCHIRMDKLRKEGLVDLFEDAIRRALTLMSVSELRAVANELVARRQLSFDDVARLIGHKPSYEP